MDYMEDVRKDVLTAIKDGYIYDYIASNYYLMDKEMLKDILLEFIYKTYRLSNHDTTKNGDVIDELKDRWGLE